MSMSCVNAARRVAGGKGTDAERSQCARFLRFGGIRSVRLSLFAEGYHKRAHRVCWNGWPMIRPFFMRFQNRQKETCPIKKERSVL